jgi:hypothetical protein
MSETKFNSHSKKAYEVSYALFRIASRLGHKALEENLEEQALNLLTAIAAGESVKSQASIRVIRHLLKFGEDTGILNPINCRLINSELDTLNSAIAEFDEAAKPAEVDLHKIFSENGAAFSRSVVNADFATRASSEYPATGKIESVSNGSYENGNVSNGLNANGNGNIVKAAMRQSAILERIRQNHDLPAQAGCRLKDIQEALQDVSERTVRYDLQNLLEQGLIERSGNGGPATFYRVRA